MGVALLPRLADRAEADRALPTALLLVAATGGLLTLGTAVLGEDALALVGGRTTAATATVLVLVLGRRRLSGR